MLRCQVRGRARSGGAADGVHSGAAGAGRQLHADGRPAVPVGAGPALSRSWHAAHLRRDLRRPLAPRHRRRLDPPGRHARHLLLRQAPHRSVLCSPSLKISGFSGQNVGSSFTLCHMLCGRCKLLHVLTGLLSTPLHNFRLPQLLL